MKHWQNQWPCQACGQSDLVFKHGTYKFHPPANIQGGQMVIDNTAWQVCPKCNDHVLSPDLMEKIGKLAQARGARPWPWKCVHCRGETWPSTVEYDGQRNFNGQVVKFHVNEVPVGRCSKCGEVVFYGDSDDVIQAAARAALKEAGGV